MGRKRDRFWEYAKELDGRFKCNFCGKEFAGGISRIKSHLSVIKGRDIDICLSVPDHVRADALQAIGSPSNKKGKQKVAILNNENVVVGDDRSCTTASIENKKKALDKKFVGFQIANGISKEASQLFVEFVKGVSEFGPNYALPNLFIRNELTLEWEGELLEYERNVKESWSETGCTLMITPAENKIDTEDELILDVNVFAYCPKGIVFLTSGNYSTIFTDICHAIEEIGERRVLQVIIDSYGAVRGLKLVEMIQERYPQALLTSRSPIKVIQGFVRPLHVTGDFPGLLAAGEMIFKYMREFSVDLGRKIFEKSRKYRKLEQMHPRSLSGRLFALHWIMEHEAEVVRVVQSLDTSSHPQDLAKWVENVVTRTTFWTLGKKMIHIHNILFQIVCLGQGMVPAFGYLYEAVNKACSAMDECFLNDPTRDVVLWKSYCHQKLRSMIKPVHAAACFLNPATMCGEKFKEDTMMKEGMDYLAKKLVVDEIERVLFLDQAQLYRAKTPSVFTDTALKNMKTLHPWAWWSYFGGSVPVLQKCAIQILSQPCGVPFDILDLSTGSNCSDGIRKMKLLMMKEFSGSIDLDRQTKVCNDEYFKEEDFVDFSGSSSKADMALNSLCGEEGDARVYWLKHGIGLRIWNLIQ